MKFRFNKQPAVHSENEQFGDHKEDGVVYHPGDVVESDKDLAALFPDKFSKLTEEQPPSPMMAKKPSKLTKEDKNKEAAEAEPEENEEEGEEREQVESELGEDVTGEYQFAKEAQVLVFKKGKTFHVTEVDTPNEAINDKPLKKNELEDYITSLQEGG